MFTKITGMAASCCIGSDIDEIGKNFSLKKSGLSYDHRFRNWIDGPLGEIDFTSFNIEKPTCACDRTVNIILSHWIELLQAQTKIFSRYKPSEIGLIIGSTTYGIEETFKSYKANVNTPGISNFAKEMMQTGKLIEELTHRFPIKGFSTAVSTACSSGSIAIGEAHSVVKSGIVKACIAGGFDLLNTVTVCGFNALQVLSTDFCAPFEDEKSGINLAEGGALFVIESKDTVVEPKGHIEGYGVSSEGYHPTHPEPEGRGMEQTMGIALKNSSINIDEIQFINAHGTGTIPNDTAEKKAITRLFGDINFYSTKKYTGHCLAGAGALEALLTIMDLNGETEKKRKKYALSNSFGFGGSNASLLFSGSKL